MKKVKIDLLETRILVNFLVDVLLFFEVKPKNGFQLGSFFSDLIMSTFARSEAQTFLHILHLILGSVLRHHSSSCVNSFFFLYKTEDETNEQHSVMGFEQKLFLHLISLLRHFGRPSTD
jgi:hypothetical protein